MSDYDPARFAQPPDRLVVRLRRLGLSTGAADRLVSEASAVGITRRQLWVLLDRSGEDWNGFAVLTREYYRWLLRTR